MSLHVPGQRFFVYQFLTVRTLLLGESACLSVWILATMPFLMFVEACAIEFLLAMFTNASQFELWFRGSGPTFLAAARMVLSVVR